MRKPVSNKGAAIVTGASRGIGAATALELARMGHPVVVNYLSRKAAAQGVVRRIQRAGGRAIAVQADVSDPAAAKALISKAIKEFGSLAILVNNAGFSSHFPHAELPASEWERGLAVNLSGAFYCSQAAIPHLKKNGWGRIANIASLRAFTGSTRGAHYSASKSGIVGLTKSLALDLGPFGVTVNAVSPGYTRTEMTVKTIKEKEKEVLASIPLGRIAEPEEIASVIAFLCSEDAAYITGQVVHANGGIFLN